MHQVGVEVVGIGALKLTGFLKEQMQQKNIYFGSLYTVRTLKEVSTFCHRTFRVGRKRVSLRHDSLHYFYLASEKLLNHFKNMPW